MAAIYFTVIQISFKKVSNEKNMKNVYISAKIRYFTKSLYIS